MRRKSKDIKEIVSRTLKKVAQMDDAKYLEPILRRFELYKYNCELFKIFEIFGRMIPFLVWVNKGLKIKEEDYFAFIFDGVELSSFKNSGPILSGEIIIALKDLKEELPFCRERNILKGILKPKICESYD